jgi:hypothetical protein
MPQAAAQVITEVPYETAQALFRDLTGMSFGSERLPTVTNQVAEGLTGLEVAPSRARSRDVWPPWRRAVVVLGIDGAYVPTRPDSAREPQEGQGRQRAKRARWRGQWRDAKGWRLSLIDGDRIVPLLSWHQRQNEHALGEALRQVKDAGLIPAEQVRLCVVADGAEWIWKHVQALFPQARQGLDYYHCAQYIHHIAQAHYGTSLQGLAWAEARR